MKAVDDPYALLILDSDPETRNCLAPLMDALGGRIWVARDRDDGLSILGQQEVDVLILALPQNHWEELALLGRVVHQYPSVVVVVLSGMVSVEAAVDIMKKGAFELLTKPLDADRLATAVTQALAKARRLKNEAPVFPDIDHVRFVAIADALPYGLLICDGDARVVFFNAVFARLLDLAPRMPIGLPIEAYFRDERLSRMIGAMAQGSVGTGAESAPLDLCAENEQVLSVRVRPLPGKYDERRGAIVTLMDVTALKLLDRVKNEFVAKVSHELRSPLSTIHEQLARVLSNMADDLPATDQRLLSRAKEKTQGLIDLIGDLLDLSRIEAGAVCEPPKSVNTLELLEKIIDFLHTRAAAKHQDLELVRSTPSLPRVQADPIALESIFGNLISNAINYTPEGGKIQVQAERAGSHLRVQVSDTGFGIAETHLPKIFDRFYRIKNDQTHAIVGTGLGLPIVKGLVESLGGEISVQSTPAQGSTFTVLLPAADGS